MMMTTIRRKAWHLVKRYLACLHWCGSVGLTRLQEIVQDGGVSSANKKALAAVGL